jgi:ribosomal protein L10
VLREGHGLRVLKNRMFRKILGAQEEEERKFWRKLHNEELHDLYSSPNIIQLKSRWVIKVKMWKVSGTENNGNAYRFLVEKP